MSKEIETNPFPGVKIIKVIGPSFQERFQNWRRAQEALAMEQQRVAFLNDTSKLPQNQKELLTPVKCRVIRSFCIKGQPVSPGAIISIEKYLAKDLRSINKVEIL